jgi:hypothetical protein
LHTYYDHAYTRADASTGVRTKEERELATRSLDGGVLMGIDAGGTFARRTIVNSARDMHVGISLTTRRDYVEGLFDLIGATGATNATVGGSPVLNLNSVHVSARRTSSDQRCTSFAKFELSAIGSGVGDEAPLTTRDRAPACPRVVVLSDTGPAWEGGERSKSARPRVLRRDLDMSAGVIPVRSPATFGW